MHLKFYSEAPGDRNASALPIFGRTLTLAVMFTLLALLDGCGMVRGAMSMKFVRTHKFLLEVDLGRDANQNSPVPVDLLLIKKKELLDSITAMQAHEWFGKKLELQRRYPGSLMVRSWEWTPGEEVPRMAIWVPRGFAGAVIFADYTSAGAHSAVLPLNKKVFVSFNEQDFTVEER